MNIYIQVWPDQSATLILDDGTSLFTYRCIEDAISVCEEWYRHQVAEEEGTLQDLSCASLC